MATVTFEGPAGISEVDLLETGEHDRFAHNLMLVFELRGELDEDRLADAVRRLGARHESFRTAFQRTAAGWRRLVYDTSSFDLTRIDLTAEADPEAAARTRALAMFRTPFDRAEPHLIRTVLLQLAAGRGWLICHCDHVALDGVAFANCITELVATYVLLSQGLAPVLAPAMQPREYVATVDAILAPLRSGPTPWPEPSLAAGSFFRPDATRPGGSDPAGARAFVALGDPDAIDALAKARGVGRAAPIVAAMALALCDRMARPDVAFTLIRSGRRDAASRGLVGCVAWGDAFGVRISEDDPLSAVLARADEFLGDTAPWRMLYIPAVDPPSRRVVLNVNRYSSALSLPGLTVFPRLDVSPEVRMWSTHDLLVQIFPVPGALQAVLRYRASLFEPATMDRFGAVMAAALRALLQDPAATVRSVLRGVSA